MPGDVRYTPGTMNVYRRLLAMMLMMTGAMHLTGCATPEGPTTFDVAPGGYARAFNTAREALRDAFFSIDRVDADAGVISTFPKASSGLATPWDSDQSTLRQEWEDLAADQQRTVRIAFERTPGQSEPSLGRVTVVIERRYRPGVRVPAKSARSASITRDPALVSRGMWPAYNVTFEEDRALATRLAADISTRLNHDQPAEPVLSAAQAAPDNGSTFASPSGASNAGEEESTGAPSGAP